MNDSMSAEEAIESLFHLYADDVYRYARYAVPNTADPRDVVQEVFLRAFCAWDSFRGDSNPKTWLLHIARNYVYDLLRKKRTEIAYQRTHKPDLSEVSVPLETFVELEEAVAKLKDDYRQVFVLRCIQDLSVEETSGILGWSQAKVKTTLHRAINDLRAELGDELTTGRHARKEGGLSGHQRDEGAFFTPRQGQAERRR